MSWEWNMCLTLNQRCSVIMWHVISAESDIRSDIGGGGVTQPPCTLAQPPHQIIGPWRSFERVTKPDMSHQVTNVSIRPVHLVCACLPNCIHVCLSAHTCTCVSAYFCLCVRACVCVCVCFLFVCVCVWRGPGDANMWHLNLQVWTSNLTLLVTSTHLDITGEFDFCLRTFWGMLMAPWFCGRLNQSRF